MSKKKKDVEETDFTFSVGKSIENARSIVKQGNFTAAIDQLFVIEKQTRLAQQGENTTKIAEEIVRLCCDNGKWAELNEYIVVLSKKRSQIKQAIAKMVQEAMGYLEKTPNVDVKVALIQVLMSVTEGKIYVEVERARLIRTLAEIREQQGKVDEAADLMQQVQVETIGSMKEQEKIEFILEAMRLTLQKKDYIRTLIISKKITPRAISKKGFEKLRIRYYRLLVKYWVSNRNYLEITRCYYNIFQTTGGVLMNPHQTLEHMCLFIILAPHDQKQHDMIQRIFREEKLQETKMKQFRKLLKMFIQSELISWTEYFLPICQGFLKNHPVFSMPEHQKQRFRDLQDRVIEHNLRVVSRFYTQIETKRLAYLLGNLSVDEVETFISKLVTDGIIFARIDRVDGIVQFKKKEVRSDNDVLNIWSGDVKNVLGQITKLNHLITKEQMMK